MSPHNSRPKMYGYIQETSMAELMAEYEASQASVAPPVRKLSADDVARLVEDLRRRADDLPSVFAFDKALFRRAADVLELLQ